jgi:hypothetical protein
MNFYLTLRLEKFVLNRDIRRKYQARTDCIRMMNVLLKQRNFKSMIRVTKEELSQFLGFQACNLLFYSDKVKELYTI